MLRNKERKSERSEREGGEEDIGPQNVEEFEVFHEQVGHLKKEKSEEEEREKRGGQERKLEKRSEREEGVGGGWG
jgi:hypothetical protein